MPLSRKARSGTSSCWPSTISLNERTVSSTGTYVKLEDTIKGFKEIIEGKHDELPEQAFYMVGTIEEAVEKARGMSGEEKAEEEPPDEPEASEEREPEPAAV